MHLGSAAAGGFHAVLDGDLFGSADRDRCRAAGIPDGVVHGPKWRVALEMLDRARANGVVLPWLTSDEEYGRATGFRHAPDDRGRQCDAEVPTTFTGWTARPPLLHRARTTPPTGWGGRGRPPGWPRRPARRRRYATCCGARPR